MAGIHPRRRLARASSKRLPDRRLRIHTGIIRGAGTITRLPLPGSPGPRHSTAHRTSIMRRRFNVMAPLRATTPPLALNRLTRPLITRLRSIPPSITLRLPRTIQRLNPRGRSTFLRPLIPPPIRPEAGAEGAHTLDSRAEAAGTGKNWTASPICATTWGAWPFSLTSRFCKIPNGAFVSFLTNGASLTF